MTSGSDPSGEPKTAPLHVAPPSDQHHSGGPPEQSVVPPAISSSPGDACPNCGAQMALDQRYCLNCGNRRGDPRLPFMDAVVFMEASKQPKGEAAAAAAAPPPPPAKSGFSPGATLIAGIATLILAVGVGVLIGRSGNDSAPVAQQQPQIIKVGGGGGEGEEETGGSTENNSGAKEANKGGNSKGKGEKKGDKGAKLEEGSSGTSKAAEEVLKPSADAKPLPPPTTKVGEDCEKGTAGCSDSGEFNGSFFGE